MSYQIVGNAFFDPYGNFVGELSSEVVQDCAAVRQNYNAVVYWQKTLDFCVSNIQQAKEFLVCTGGWTLLDLDLLDDIEINRKVLWLACNDIKNLGEFTGLNP